MIKINGKEIDWIDGEGIEITLKRAGSCHPIMIVSLNGKWLRRGEWAEIEINDGDEINTHEIIAGG